MKMKKFLVALPALLAFFVFVPHASAQTSGADTPASTTAKAHKGKSSGAKSGRVDAKLADLSTTLNLSDDQKAKIQPILQDEETKIHDAKKAGSGDDEKAKTKAIRGDANAQIRALLTPDQQTKFDASKKGHKKHEASASNQS